MRSIAPALMALTVFTTAAAEDSTARQAVRAYGEFSRGISEAIVAPMAESLPRNVIENVNPRPKAECLQESGGVVNKQYMRCRNGAQLTWRVRSNGERELVREQPLPEN